MAKENTRKEKERQHRREEILTAAESIFAEKGFAATTMEDVAVKSEFGVGTLYCYFPSKEDLYQPLIEQRAQTIYADVMALLDEAGSEPMDVVREFIRAKITVCYRYEPFMKLYTRERMGDRFNKNPLWTEIVGPLFARVFDVLGEAFDRGKASGVFSTAYQTRDLVIGLDGMTDGFLYAWLDNPQEMDFRAKEQHMTTLFLYGIRNAEGAR